MAIFHVWTTKWYIYHYAFFDIIYNKPYEYLGTIRGIFQIFGRVVMFWLVDMSFNGVFSYPHCRHTGGSDFKQIGKFTSMHYFVTFALSQIPVVTTFTHCKLHRWESSRFIRNSGFLICQIFFSGYGHCHISGSLNFIKIIFWIFLVMPFSSMKLTECKKRLHKKQPAVNKIIIMLRLRTTEVLKGNLLSQLHGLFVSINSKGSLICTI